MLNPHRLLSSVRSLLLSAAALLAVPTVEAQKPVTVLDQQLSRIDVAVSGMGEFTNTVSGTNYLGTTLTQKPSTTLGALVTLRYIKSPLVGAEFNFGYARYTQNFSAYIPGGAQTNADEYSLGYVVHTPHIFGIGTFVSAGAGSTEFKGTKGGGQGLPSQARMTYYYDAGLEDQILSSHFGIRAQFRQNFFLSPDFGQNYLTIKQRQSTIEPAIGVYIHF